MVGTACGSKPAAAPGSRRAHLRWRPRSSGGRLYRFRPHQRPQLQCVTVECAQRGNGTDTKADRPAIDFASVGCPLARGSLVVSQLSEPAVGLAQHRAGGELQPVATDVTILSPAVTSLSADLKAGQAKAADIAGFRSAVAALRSAVRLAEDDPIPGCVSGAHQAEATGLADLGHAVVGFGAVLGAVGSGDYPAAYHDMQSAIVVLQPGSAQMAKATIALNKSGIR